MFEREAGKDTVRAVAGANIPTAWQMRAVHLGEVPLLVAAFNAPDRLIEGSVLTQAQRERSAPLKVCCGVLPDPVDPIYVLMLLAPADPVEASAVAIALDAMRHMLGASAALAAGNAERSRTLAAIHRAKIEWEQTGDALPEIVGLLDQRGRIVRVNRALERWNLGAVRSAMRADLHAVLHGSCNDADCGLRAALARAWQEYTEQHSASFEYADPKTDLEFIIDLRQVTVELGASADAPWHRVAFVVSNVTELRRTERRLMELNRTLEERVQERTTEITGINRMLREEVSRRGDAERSLLGSQTELQALSERLMSAQEAERTRIAQDLHDSIGQSLSAIKYSLERAQVLTRRQETREAADVVEGAVQRVQRVIDDIRGISMNLRPALLDDLGAASAVRWLCREWHDVYSDIALDTDIAVADTEIPQVLGTSVFRAVQESLNNVARHAGARRVSVSMRVEEGTLSVTVSDDGSGFAINGDVRRLVERPGLKGLRGLRERAEQSGGRCHVASSPGRGTTVRLEWPVAQGRAAQEASALLN
jgi:signal transduction histidine kinase